MSTKKTPEPRDVHEQVSKAYEAALERATAKGAGGCCQPKPASPEAVAARTAGYGAELDGVAPTLASSSFGCGNPLAFSDVEPGETVVDLGSGAGLDLLIAAKKVGATGRVIGIDMTDAMVESARKTLAEAGIDYAEVRKGIIEELPVADGEADWVISNCVINLSPNKPAVFREISRILEPGGRISISDIVAEDIPAWMRDNAAAYSACIGGAISEEEYCAGLMDAGLVDVQVTERIVYDAEQIYGMVGTDVEAMGMSAEEAKFTARKR
jgi:SAM-dependent methyltransferase